MARNGFSHRGAAGVAGADEEDSRAEEALNDALIVNSGADNFVGIIMHADNRARLEIARRAGIENETDFAVEKLGDGMPIGGLIAPDFYRGQGCAGAGDD